MVGKHQSLPDRWTEEQFQADIEKATAVFRNDRMQEPLEQYLEAYDFFRSAVENLLEITVDLSEAQARAVDLLTDPGMATAVRYLSSPPVSEDDLVVLAEARLSPSRLQADGEMARRIMQTVFLGLDRNRFPWIADDREPTAAERETAIVSTTAMIASRRVMTARANTSKTSQEALVAEKLQACGFRKVQTREVRNFSHAPQIGEFCHESLFGSRKADLIVGLWDGRKMPIECKVSNSSTNSVKRLNNDAAVKAKSWLSEFGTSGVVPSAVLAGVFKLRNLVAAQNDGLSIFWAHDLAALEGFLDRTKESA